MKIDISDNTEILVFTGPESTGKSTCAERIAREYSLPHVLEYAREYLTDLGRDYSFSDIQKMAIQQLENERAAHKKHPLIICDTDLVTLEIWALEKFGRSLEFVDDLILKKHYLLCFPDIPWQPDPLRENPEDRMRLFERYKAYLEDKNVIFTILGEVERKAFSFDFQRGI